MSIYSELPPQQAGGHQNIPSLDGRGQRGGWKRHQVTTPTLILPRQGGGNLLFSSPQQAEGYSTASFYKNIMSNLKRLNLENYPSFITTKTINNISFFNKQENAKAVISAIYFFAWITLYTMHCLGDTLLLRNND